MDAVLELIEDKVWMVTFWIFFYSFCPFLRFIEHFFALMFFMME